MSIDRIKKGDKLEINRACREIELYCRGERSLDFFEMWYDVDGTRSTVDDYGARLIGQERRSNYRGQGHRELPKLQWFHGEEQIRRTLLDKSIS